MNIKKINKVILACTIFVLLMTSVGILGTYLNDYLTSINWYGDYTQTICYPSGNCVEEERSGDRRIWLSIGSTLLFMISLSKFCFKINHLIEEE